MISKRTTVACFFLFFNKKYFTRTHTHTIFFPDPIKSTVFFFLLQGTDVEHLLWEDRGDQSRDSHSSSGANGGGGGGWDLFNEGGCPRSPLIILPPQEMKEMFSGKETMFKGHVIFQASTFEGCLFVFFFFSYKQ